jgi:hypothetical protein
MMAKYRKKPIVIEAEQLIVDSDSRVNRYVPNGVNFGRPRDIDDFASVHSLDGKYWVSTLEGPLVASDRDWIITGVKGERYPCKPDIFDMTYEPVEG